MPFILDLLDVVQDIPSTDANTEEDPRVYVSKKTGRGPLLNNWIATDVNGQFIPQNGCTNVMCAYKLCRVEFRYWGMQTRIERFIHDIGK